MCILLSAIHQKAMKRQCKVALRSAMQNYQADLDYELELVHQSGPVGAVKEAVLVLDELARGIASGKMPPSEVEQRKRLFKSLAEELKDLPEALEKFRWTHFFHSEVGEFARNPADQMTPDEYHRFRDATHAIVREQCGFLRPYLGVQLSEIKALLDHYRSHTTQFRKSKTSMRPEGVIKRRHRTSKWPTSGRQ